MSHYILYIDDTGSRDPDHKEAPRNDGMNCFGLGGVLVHKDNVETIVEMYQKFVSTWNIDYPLHSTEIRGKRNNFRWLKDDVKQTERFYTELQNLMVQIPVIGFATVVDRDGYNERYRGEYGDGRWQLCKTAYSILLERVAKHCNQQEATFEVIFEEVGKKEDRAIIEYHRAMKTIGHPFNEGRSYKYNCLVSSDYKRLVSNDPRRNSKKNIFLQIADIYLYTMAKHGYDSLHSPWFVLMESGRIIDALCSLENREMLGVKYSCFDQVAKTPHKVE